jgi:hypothetical protein
MKIITSSELIDYTAEPCPYCGDRALYLEFDEWDADGTPTEAGTHAHCKNENEDDPRDHADMPYVYWLPIDIRAAHWARENVRVVEQDDRERLADWNAGKALPGGMGR